MPNSIVPGAPGCRVRNARTGSNTQACEALDEALALFALQRAVGKL